MRLLTLLAGYAAGLAVAMKYRKDAGTSKMATSHPDASKLDAFIEEVVDIHKNVFSDISAFFTANFDDVQNFDDLQGRLAQMVGNFSREFETHIADARTKGNDVHQAALSFYEIHKDTFQSTLVEAKDRALSFAGVTVEQADAWIARVKDEIESLKSPGALELKQVSPKKPTKS